MFKSFIALFSAVALCGTCIAQDGVARVVAQVESNNIELASYRSLTEARSLEARVGNSLSNPEVEFIHSWGSPSEAGKTGELTVTQEFDFPSAYALRGKLAKTKARQYDSEYDALRQKILLEAQLLCFDVIAMRQQIEVQQTVLSHAEQTLSIAQERLDKGDGSILDREQARMQMMTERNALRLLQIDLEQALSRLEALNGGCKVDFEDTRFAAPQQLPDLQSVLDDWRTASPQLRAALLEQESAEAELRVSRTESLPKFTLGYKHEYTASERFHGVVAGMSIPMFGNRNNVKRSKAQVQYARSAAEASLSDMMSEVASLYEKTRLLAEASKSADETVLGLESFAVQLDKSLRAGGMGMVEYFVQMNSLLSIRKEAIDFKLQYVKAYAQLMAVNL